MKKFQEGGVYDVQPLVPGTSPINNIPNIQYPEMSAVDLQTILNLQDAQDVRQARQDSRVLQQQAQEDKANSVYYNLHDDLFGDVHSEYQQEVLASAKEKYNVTDDLVNSDNLFTIKDQTHNLYKATSDPSVMRVFGEVEFANKIREGLPTQMSVEQKDAFATEWQNYLNFRPTKPGERYDMTKLALAATNVTAPKAAGNPANFFPSTQKVATQLANVDLTDPNNQAVAMNAIRNAWFIQDPDEAVAQKLIERDPVSGVPTFTPLGEQVAMQQLEAASLGASASQQAKIDLDAAKKENTKAINPPKPKPETPDEKKLDQIAEGWNIVKSIAEREGVLGQIEAIDPNTSEWLKAKLIKMMSEEGGASITSKQFRTEWLRELLKIAPKTGAEQNTFDPATGMMIQGTSQTTQTTGVQPTTITTRDAPTQGGFKQHTGIK